MQNQAHYNAVSTANNIQELELSLVPKDAKEETVFVTVNHMQSPSKTNVWTDAYSVH